MPSAATSVVAPLYLFACLILGGSAQGIWANAALQLTGLAIIAWSTMTDRSPLPFPARLPLLLLMVAMVIVILQEIPLSPSFWAHGTRARIVDSYAVLGRPAPALPISFTPYQSLSDIFCLIPPLAMFCAVFRSDANRRSLLAAALLAATTLAILLGALQVVSPDAGSRWYLYGYTNRGLAVGFFANANHMATLLVISIPFIAAIAASARSGNVQRYSALLSVLAGSSLLLIVGLALNGSLAGYALAVPVTIASLMLTVPATNRFRVWFAIAAAVSTVAAIGAIATSSIGAAKLGVGANVSVQSREQMLQTTARAFRDTMPFGSGLGSFAKVYRLYERPDQVTSEWVVHAHNDYAEVALELGAGGIVLMLLILGWWVTRVWAVWKYGEGGPFARAASIASAAVLAHSAVEFPLRTAAISACFAMCLAFLADRKTPVRAGVADLRPARHLVIH